ncbi:MAG: hypothetical protein LCH79_14055 [Proteobacteria bacterium]|jgi:hypothetical protein|nr:hypothetical protein [Pseudomonadota bacterium]
MMATFKAHALAAVLAAGACSGAMACPAASELTPAHLWGLWRVSFEGGGSPPTSATVLFEKHPERTESVRGAINRDSAQSLLAGDVDEGVLALDESDDGLQISATWSGNVADTSCGKEFTGIWRRSKDNTERSFVLRKLPGWQ